MEYFSQKRPKDGFFQKLNSSFIYSTNISWALIMC